MRLSKKTLIAVILGLAVSIWHSTSFSAVYKCETNTGIHYSTTPCTGQQPKTNDLPLIIQPQDTLSNSTKGHIETLSGTLEHWQCDSLVGAIESMPSRLSVSALLNDFINRPHLEIEEFGNTRRKYGWESTTIEVPSQFTDQPCNLKVSSSLIDQQKRISVSINMRPANINKEWEISASNILDSLEKNGYSVKKREHKTKDYYTESWETVSAKCNTRLSLRYNTFEYVNFAFFRTICYTKKSP